MFKRAIVTGAALVLWAASPAYGVDGKGLTDGSIYDHTGVSPYERTRRHARPRAPRQDDSKYPLRCYWTVKTTDGWWATGATQVCVRDRRN